MTTPTPLTAQWLQNLLTGLGSTADEVAATLRTAGIKGVRTDAHDCPGARYIAAKARELVAPDCQVAVTLTQEQTVIGITTAGPDDYQESRPARPKPSKTSSAASTTASTATWNWHPASNAPHPAADPATATARSAAGCAPHAVDEPLATRTLPRASFTAKSCLANR